MKLSALLFALLLSACATLQSPDMQRIGIQYAALKMIENSDSITAEGVLDKVAELRGLVDAQIEINPQDLVDDVLKSISPADRFLVQSFLVELEYYVLQAELPEGQRVRIHTLLNWVAQAARIS